MEFDPEKYPSLFLDIGLWVDNSDGGYTAELAYQSLYGDPWGSSTTEQTLPHTLDELAKLIREKQAEVLRELVTDLWQAAEKERLDIGKFGVVPPLLHPPSLRHAAAFIGNRTNKIEGRDDD